MKKKPRHLLFWGLSVLLVGCSLHPLGIPQDQWQSMTPEQQQEARMEQARQNEAARQRRHQLEMQQQARQTELDLEREGRLRRAEPGDVLHCTLEAPEANWSRNKWRSAQPLAIELLQGESREVSIRRAGKSNQQRKLLVSFQGLTVSVCSAREDCAVMVATGGEFQRGKQTSIRTGALKAELRCQYPPRFWRP